MIHLSAQNPSAVPFNAGVNDQPITPTEAISSFTRRWDGRGVCHKDR